MGITIGVIYILTGCAPTTQSPSQVSAEKPTSDKALVIVERESQVLGGGVTVNVFDNKTIAGKLGSGGKLAWLCAPGQRDIEIDDLGGAALLPEWGKAKNGRRLTVKAGQTYHYKFNVNVAMLEGPGIFTISGMTEPEMNAMAVDQEKKFQAAWSRLRKGLDPTTVAKMLPCPVVGMPDTAGKIDLVLRTEGAAAGHSYGFSFRDNKLIEWLEIGGSSWLVLLKTQPFARAGRSVAREYRQQSHL